jgi:predicted SAM-dependent methyltransferase
LVSPLLKLDLACGKKKREGFIGVDIVEMDGVDLVHDLTKYPWPFPDESVEEIYCSHYIEHAPDIVAFMNEMHRILVTGGKARLIAPYYNSVGCWQDPTHKRAISESTFAYFIKDWLKVNKLDHYDIKADFQVDFEYYPNQEWMEANERAKNGEQVKDWATVHGESVYFPLHFAIRYLTNTMDNIIVNLVKK